MRLYELSSQYEQVRALAADPDIDPQAITDTLESVEGAVKDKLLACACIVRELEGDASAIKAEVERLSAKLQTAQGRVDGLKEYMRGAMIATNTETAEDARFKLRLQQGPAAVEITDADLIPSTFKRASLSLSLAELPEELVPLAKVEVDRRAVLQAAKDGATVQGTQVVRRKVLYIR